MGFGVPRKERRGYTQRSGSTFESQAVLTAVIIGSGPTSNDVTMDPLLNATAHRFKTTVTEDGVRPNEVSFPGHVSPSTIHSVVGPRRRGLHTYTERERPPHNRSLSHTKRNFLFITRFVGFSRRHVPRSIRRKVEPLGSSFYRTEEVATVTSDRTEASSR